MAGLGSNFPTFYNLITDKPTVGPAFPHPGPGMLSAALQGTLLPSHQQPPTPPRTPQGKMMEEPRAGPGMVSKMPSLLAMAGLQQQMLAKPSLPPLASGVTKQGLQGKQILRAPPANFNLSKSAKRTFLSRASLNIFQLSNF